MGRGQRRGSRETRVCRAGHRARDQYAHSHDVPQGVVLLLHDVGARVGHLGVAGESQLPDPVGKDELLRAGRLVHGDGPQIVRGREW